LHEALVEMNYLQKNNDIYSVADDVHERLINKDGDEYEGDFWQFLLYLIDPWKTLPHVLKNGEPDMGSYKNFSFDDFIRGMNSPWKKKLAPEIVDLCLKHHGEAKTVTDIGGAPGTMAREFASRGLRTLIYDLPDSVEVMRQELTEIENLEIHSGDATKSLPDEKYDIAFLGNICHGQTPIDNAKMINMCHEHLNDGGIIVIFDNIRGESYLGARLALHMVTQSSKGDIFTREEYTHWLEEAGFSNISVEKLSDPAWKLIIACR